jgi:hypothetical protein
MVELVVCFELDGSVNLISGVLTGREIERICGRCVGLRRDIDQIIDFWGAGKI